MAAAIFITSCGQSDTKQKELELEERELALKEKELALKEKDPTNTKTQIVDTVKKNDTSGIKIILSNSKVMTMIFERYE